MTDLAAQLQALLLQNEALRERVKELEAIVESRDRWVATATRLAAIPPVALPEKTAAQEVEEIPADSIVQKLREVWHAARLNPAVEAQHPLPEPERVPEERGLPAKEEEPDD